MPPPRPTQPKQPVPMEVNPSIKSLNINYMNRPEKSPLPSSGNSSNIPRKQQRLYNMEVFETNGEVPTLNEEQNQVYEDDCVNQYSELFDNEANLCNEERNQVYEGDYANQNSEFLENELNLYDENPYSIPYLEFCLKNGSILRFLVDTGANKHFVSKTIWRNSTPVDSVFKIHSAAGQIIITHKVVGKLFQKIGVEKDFIFFVLPGLRSFDIIIGDDTLKELKVVIKLKSKISSQVNYNEMIRHEDKDIENIVNKHNVLFGPVADSGVITTNVRAEIRTSTDEPIYTKSCLYPSYLRAEVENQIAKMLEDGVIRPSESSYNSPLWIVVKKPKPTEEKQ